MRPEYAIVGIDLADRKQMVVVTDHDSRVLARRTFRCAAWELGVALDWAAGQAARAGFTGVTVACEPTGHRWRVLGQPRGGAHTGLRKLVSVDSGLSFGRSAAAPYRSLVTNGEGETEVDPLTIGAGAAAKSVGDESGKLLSRVLGPSADVIGEWLRGKTEYRLANVDRIARKAADKAGSRGEGQVSPRVAHQILDDGSFCDDQLMAEYPGGVLAASKTPGGRDDRGVAWSDFVNGMSALEVRGHFLLYRAWDELLSSRADLDLWRHSDRESARLFLDEIEFQQTLTVESDVTTADALSHTLNGLSRRGLVETAGWGARDWVAWKDHPFDFVVTSRLTFAGLELYGWALGIAGLTPANFWRPRRGWVDPALPRLTSIQLAGSKPPVDG